MRSSGFAPSPFTPNCPRSFHAKFFLYDPEVQFLTNRGYAVLQVNYRGSTGFGLKFFNAGNNEYGRGMQQDLYDAVQWAIDQKIVDPKRIASMGGSGGGFATLCALEMRPNLFACGVDVVGPSDQAANFRPFPVAGLS